jgi:hypothetical protein
MAGQSHSWVVDVLEESSASVEVDGKSVIVIPRWLLPASAREGDMLRVTHDRPAEGQRSTLTIEADPAATKKARRVSSAQVAKAQAQSLETDPGGDITL